MLWFVKEVCCVAGEVGGKEICVAGYGGQNNELVMIVSTEYMETVEIVNRTGNMRNGYWFWGPKCIVIDLFLLFLIALLLYKEIHSLRASKQKIVRILGNKIFLCLCIVLKYSCILPH